MTFMITSNAHAFLVEVKTGGNWLVPGVLTRLLQVECLQPGVFKLVGENLTDDYSTCWCFSSWDPRMARSVDFESDAATSKLGSNKLLMPNVELDARGIFRAPSIEALWDAFDHVLVRTYSPYDM